MKIKVLSTGWRLDFFCTAAVWGDRPSLRGSAPAATRPVPVVEDAYQYPYPTRAEKFLAQITLGQVTPAIPYLAKAIDLLYFYLVGLMVVDPTRPDPDDPTR